MVVRMNRRKTVPLPLSPSRQRSDKDKKLLSIGDPAPDFELVDHNGKKYRLSSFQGRRVLLSFHRFAACPICAYNADRLKQHAAFLKNAGVVTICIFKSTPENVARYNSSNHNEDFIAMSRRKSSVFSSFIALSDKKGSAYKSFMVLKSTRAAIRGRIEMIKNFKKYRQFIDVSAAMNDLSGVTNTRQLPADFLIDEEGVIVDLFRAEKMIDQMPFERIEAFIPEEKLCRCNKKDCIVPRCRRVYEEIKKESHVFMGDLLYETSYRY